MVYVDHRHIMQRSGRWRRRLQLWRRKRRRRERGASQPGHSQSASPARAGHARLHVGDTKAGTSNCLSRRRKQESVLEVQQWVNQQVFHVSEH